MYVNKEEVPSYPHMKFSKTIVVYQNYEGNGM